MSITIVYCHCYAFCTSENRNENGFQSLDDAYLRQK